MPLPALSRALKLQEKAAKVGFDWNDVRAVLAKLREEIAEVEAELGGGWPEALSEEVGDLLFAAVNLARHLNVDPEAALRAANGKFERRFAHIEHRLAEDGRKPENAGLEAMETLWVEAKERGESLRIYPLLGARETAGANRLCAEWRCERVGLCGNRGPFLRGRPAHAANVRRQCLNGNVLCELENYGIVK